MALLDRVEHGPDRAIVAIPRLVAGSTALRERLFIGWEREAAALTPVIAEEAGERARRPRPGRRRALAGLDAPARLPRGLHRLLAGEDQHAVAADLREQARRAYDQLESGLRDYGVKPS